MAPGSSKKAVIPVLSGHPYGMLCSVRLIQGVRSIQVPIQLPYRDNENITTDFVADYCFRFRVDSRELNCQLVWIWIPELTRRNLIFNFQCTWQQFYYHCPFNTSVWPFQTVLQCLRPLNRGVRLELFFTVNKAGECEDSDYCPFNKGCPLNIGLTVADKSLSSRELSRYMAQWSKLRGRPFLNKVKFLIRITYVELRQCNSLDQKRIPLLTVILLRLKRCSHYSSIIINHEL